MVANQNTEFTSPHQPCVNRKYYIFKKSHCLQSWAIADFISNSVKEESFIGMTITFEVEKSTFRLNVGKLKPKT